MFFADCPICSFLAPYRYNSKIDSWNNDYEPLFSRFRPLLTFNDVTYHADVETSPKGMNWPVRDSCTNKFSGSPSCLEAKQNYYYFRDIPLAYINQLLLFMKDGETTIPIHSALYYANRTYEKNFSDLDCQSSLYSFLFLFDR